MRAARSLLVRLRSAAAFRPCCVRSGPWNARSGPRALSVRCRARTWPSGVDFARSGDRSGYIFVPFSVVFGSAQEVRRKRADMQSVSPMASEIDVRTSPERRKIDRKSLRETLAHDCPTRSLRKGVSSASGRPFRPFGAPWEFPGAPREIPGASRRRPGASPKRPWSAPGNPRTAPDRPGSARKPPGPILARFRLRFGRILVCFPVVRSFVLSFVCSFVRFCTAAGCAAAGCAAGCAATGYTAAGCAALLLAALLQRKKIRSNSHRAFYSCDTLAAPK